MSVHGLPWRNWLLQASGMTLAYLGAELNSRLNARGVHAWIAANIALFVLHLLSGLVLLGILDLLYIRLNVRALQRWTAAQKQTGPVSS
jgi:hypothetical protein